MYLRKGHKPVEPYHADWWQRIQYPQPIFVTESVDQGESSGSLYVNTDEMIGAGIIQQSDHQSAAAEQFVTPGGPEAPMEADS